MNHRDKNKQNITVNDTDKWFQNQIDGEKYYSAYYWYDYWEDEECGGHHRNCDCELCRPDNWASVDDEISYHKSNKREQRFRQLFNETTKIGDFATFSSDDLFPYLR